MNSDDFSLSLKATHFIDSEEESIHALSRDITSSSDSTRESAIRLFECVRDSVRYNPYSPMLNEQDYKASIILERGFGYCVQKAILLAALCRSSGIPAILCFADIRSHRMPKELHELMGTNLFTYHGYTKLWLENKWVKATPAFDSNMCRNNGFHIVHFDGINDAILPKLDVEGKKHIEYVRNIGCYDDLPLQDILNSFYEVYVKPNPNLLEKIIQIQKKMKKSPSV